MTIITDLTCSTVAWDNCWIALDTQRGRTVRLSAPHVMEIFHCHGLKAPPSWVKIGRTVAHADREEFFRFMAAHGDMHQSDRRDDDPTW